MSGRRKEGFRKSGTKSNLVWGVNAVNELLRVRPELVIECMIDSRGPVHRHRELVERARQCGLAVSRRPFDAMLQDLPHQGVAAKIRPFPVLSEQELLRQCREKQLRGGSLLLLALDTLQDPQNTGAVLRSALAAGVDLVITCRDRSAPLSGAVARSSAGALFHHRIAQVTNLSRTLVALKKLNIWVAGATRSAEAVACFDTDLSGSLCLVLGNEDKGIRPNVLKQCDFQVTIPMEGDLDSLNVAAAASVLLFESLRQRRSMI